MIGIYKFTSKTTGMSYIGQSIHIEKRYQEHLHEINNKNSKWYQALKEQGIDNFEFSILEICEPFQLDEKEIYWIEKYDSYLNGYNSTPGGSSKYYNPQPIYEAWDEGLSPSEIAKKLNIGTSCVYYNLINYKNYNKHEAKVRGGNLAYKSNNKQNSAIYQYDLNGNFIKKWNSRKEIQREKGWDSSLIGKVITGKRNTAYNYQWTNYFLEQIKPYNGKSTKPKQIFQYDLNNNLLKEYTSLKEAAKAVNGDSSAIKRVCDLDNRTAYGFKWKLKEVKYEN